MRYNGKLWYEVIPEQTFNEYGELVTGEASWSEAVDCSISTNSDTRKGTYEDGQFRMSSFTVLTELLSTAISFSRVKLQRLGEDLGEYQVISVEHITTQNRTKIIV